MLFNSSHVRSNVGLAKQSFGGYLAKMEGLQTTRGPKVFEIKGDQGAAEAKRCIAMTTLYLGKAMEADSNARNIKPEQIVPWIAGR